MRLRAWRTSTATTLAVVKPEPDEPVEEPEPDDSVIALG